MADLIVPAGDYGYPLTFTITTPTGVAFDLSSAVVTMKVWTQGYPASLVMSASTTIVSATSGTCSYTLASTDLIQKGTYNIILQISNATRNQTTRTYVLQVTENA